jgi:hypothetical protein
MLQVIHIDVAKLDRDAAHVAIAIHIFLQMYVPNISSVFQTYVCKCFIWMMHMFHTYVASIFYLDIAYILH